MRSSHPDWSVSNSKHEAHTVVAVALYPHVTPVSARHEEQSVCVEHTDVVDVLVVDVLVVVVGQFAAFSAASSTQVVPLTVHPWAAPQLPEFARFEHETHVKKASE